MDADETFQSRSLRHAENRGLRLAVFIRTAAIAAMLVFIAWVTFIGTYSVSPYAFLALGILLPLGLLDLSIIGTKQDRWWAKYAIYALDVAAICALFTLIPVSRAYEVPQIIAFRAYGIYYLFPLLALATLSLSWRLVAWTGGCIVVFWWAAFGWVVAGMERTLSWADLPTDATSEDYRRIFLDIDFIGSGNRFEETAFVTLSTVILALSVRQARRLFVAERGQRAARRKVSQTLGRFVPNAIVKRLEGDGTFAPIVAPGTAMILDIAGFTAWSEGRDSGSVIAELNAFLARCTAIVEANGGVIITYLGDGYLATFGNPEPLANSHDAALAAAQDILEQDGFPVRIGLASGEIAAGMVGSNTRQAFTVYGDPINRAARLEGLAKRLGVSLVSDTEHGSLKLEGAHALEGFSQPVDVFFRPQPAHSR